MVKRPSAGRARLLCSLVATLAGWSFACVRPAEPNKHLLIVVDGLRPDYLRDDLMPALAALGRRGVVFSNHHAVYPTVTRVNASSISTGSYPEAHGLMGNTVFFPRVDSLRFLDTSDHEALAKIQGAEGQLLTAPTLGELLRQAGRRLLVVSSGSTGSALLNNHAVSGGAVLHPQLTLPDSLKTDMARLGPPPAYDEPAVDRYAVRAFLEVGLPRIDPSVTVMWLGALDSTAHDHGIGTPRTLEVLRHVDESIVQVEEGLRAAGLFDRYNIWVTSDHGFSTYTGGIDTAALLKPFAGSLPDGSPRIVLGGGAIYVRDRDDATIASIVAALQREASVGAIFTRGEQPGSFDGQVAGTLSFDVARWTHDRSADVLFSPAWTDNANGFGFRGTSASEGTAGHGSSSRWDVQNTLVAAGPDLEKGLKVSSPSANVDFAPTFLTLFGLSVPGTMHGRPLAEALTTGGSVSEVRTSSHTVRTADGTYELTASFSAVAANGREYRYFDNAKATRRPPASTSP